MLLYVESAYTTVQTRVKVHRGGVNIHRPCLIYTAGSVFHTKILYILANAVFIGDGILCFFTPLKGVLVAPISLGTPSPYKFFFSILRI